MKFRTTNFLASVLLGLCISSSIYADPIVHARTASNVDWTSAGVSGTGGGSGSIALTGVSGTVTGAFLYWHGVDIVGNGGDGNYDNAAITFDSNAVTGTAIGTSSTNCWGSGNSVAYSADVTAYVSGDGVYALSGLSAKAGHSSNGASLVVTFDDGDSGNNRDLVFFEGNDSSVAGYVGDDAGWTANLSPINYGGGSVGMEFHLADGQSFTDDTVNLTTPNGSFAIADSNLLWDGNSLPSAGSSRATNGNLYDIHLFDITSAFGGVAGSVDLNLAGQFNPSDCHGLLLALVDLEPGSAPPPEPPIAPMEVPTLNSTMLAVLAGLLLLIGVAATRKRRLG
jgi:hypothetical protein